MKKIFSFILSAFICANLFAIEAKVVSVSGKVQVQKGTAWVDVRPGDVLKKGDLVQTGFKSEAVVAITSANQNSKLTIGQLSRITIEQLAENSTGDKTSVYVATGSAKSEIKKTEDRRANYTVRGPVATASVRGTEFDVKNGFASASINTEEGIVAAWKTSASNAAPSVTSAREDAEFINSTSDGNSAKDVASDAPHGSFTVGKGQSAEFTESKEITSSENAIIKATTIPGMTCTALEFESDGNYSEASLNDASYTLLGIGVSLSNP